MRSVTIILSIFLMVGKMYANAAFPDTTKRKKLSQMTVAELRRAEKAHKGSYDYCVLIKRYSLKKRLSKYPFNKARKIVAVSFKLDLPGGDLEIDSVSKNIRDTIFETGLHIKNGILNMTSIKEFKVLSDNQISRLTNIIYNTDFRVHDGFNMIHEFSCFDPRNALIFYDKDGQIFDFIEICFECNQSSSQSQRITVGSECTQKYEMLKKFFISVGINFGTKIKEKTE